MDIFNQLFINIVVPGFLFGIMAAGFSVYYNVSKVLDLSQGALVLISGYIFFQAVALGVFVPVAIVLAVAGSVLVGFFINAFVYEKLRRRKRLSQVIAMIASAAVLLLLQNALLAQFGSRTKVVQISLKKADAFSVGGAFVTPWQIVTVVVSIVVWCGVYYFLRSTKMGTALRAVSDNEDVAEVVGISGRKARRNAMTIAACIAGIAGVLAAVEYNLNPHLGVEWAIRDFSRAVVGGVGSLPGALLGSFIIQSAEELGAWFWTSSYKEVISLTLVFVLLIIKPTGIFGRKKD